MSITLNYQPGAGFSYKEKFFPWKSDRETVRKNLPGKFSDQDLAFENITSKRDIYTELAGEPVYIFLNYDEHSRLIEVEIHKGVTFIVAGKSLTFNTAFFDVVESLSEISINNKLIDRGEAIFFDLKMSISADATMGADINESTLSYLNCAEDIGHFV